MEVIDKSIFEVVDKYIKLRPTTVQKYRGSNLKYNYIYLIINKVTKQFYIGRKTNKNILNSYFGSGTHIKRAIKLYGITNFSKFIISFHDNLDEVTKEEEKLITKKMIDSTECYNLTYGGNDLSKLLEYNKKVGNYKKGKDHHWYGGKSTMHLRIAQGLHKPGKIAKENGTHHFIGKTNPNYKRLLNNTHNFLGDNHPVKLAIKNGTYINPNLGKKAWNNNKATKESKIIWVFADLFFREYLEKISLNKQKNLSSRTIEYINQNFNIKCTKSPILSIIKKLKAGWVPENDLDWVKFKNEEKEKWFNTPYIQK